VSKSFKKKTQIEKTKKIKKLCREPDRTLGKEGFAEGPSSWRSAKNHPLPSA